MIFLYFFTLLVVLTNSSDVSVCVSCILIRCSDVSIVYLLCAGAAKPMSFLCFLILGWRGVVWCGVVCRGVTWCGVAWCGVVWCGVAWRGVVLGRGVVWCDVVCCGAA